MEFRTRMERISRTVQTERTERIVRNVYDESNESNERYKRNERKKEMAIGGDATRHSCAPPKNPTILSHFSAIWH